MSIYFINKCIYLFIYTLQLLFTMQHTNWNNRVKKLITIKELIAL